MANRKRNLLLIILIVIVSFGLFGFSGSPAPAIQDGDPNAIGWIEITIAAEAILYNESIAGTMVWFPSQVVLPITRGSPSSKWNVNGDTAYTALKTEGLWAGNITWDIIQSLVWEVNAILNPDCSVEIFIDAITYPGVGIACDPVFGCFTEPIPAEIFEGPYIKIPGGETMGIASWNEIPGTTGELTIFIESMTAGGACNVAHYLP